MESFVNKLKHDLSTQIEELRPAVAEFRRLERMRRSVENENREQWPSKFREAQVLDTIDASRTPVRRKDVALSLHISQARAGQVVNTLIRDGRVADGPEGLNVLPKAHNLRDDLPDDHPRLEFDYRIVQGDRDA